MKHLLIWLGRRKLHQWLAYMERECPEAGLHPCHFPQPGSCDCHLIARREFKGGTGYSIMRPRRPEVAP